MGKRKEERRAREQLGLNKVDAVQASVVSYYQEALEFSNQRVTASWAERDQALAELAALKVEHATLGAENARLQTELEAARSLATNLEIINNVKPAEKPTDPA